MDGKLVNGVKVFCRNAGARVDNVTVMSLCNTKWKSNSILFADDTVLFSENEKDL